jgi:c-di-GMP-binding flagellar brake protein YcgR
MWIFFLVFIVLLFSAGIYLRIAGGGRFPWLQFYTKGKESGFTFHEINLLRRVAVENKLQNPTALFWSIKMLDRSVKEIILKMRAESKEHDEEANRLLAKLFELRKRVEFDLPRYKIGLKSSRKIVVRQRVKITLPGIGPFLAMVVDNRPRYFALSYPQGPDLPDGFSWKGQEVGIYFWRSNDAGYFFKTKVINDFSEKEYPIIHVNHSDSLIRTQQRKSVRVTMEHAALVYPLKSIGLANEMVEETKGLRCRLKDLSEGGAALLIGGRTKVGMPLKIQFTLSDTPIVMNGVAKGINYNSKRNTSILHMQAVPPSTIMRNKILSYVYNLFGNREKELSVAKTVPLAKD